MDQSSNLLNLSSVSSWSSYGHDQVKEPLHKVQDITRCISSGQELPPHIQAIMTLKGDQDFVSIHEWAARICHILLVESGFFPSFDDNLLSAAGLSPRSAMDIPDIIRIPEYSRQLPPTVMFSEHGIYALKYKAILCELVDLPPAATTENTETSGDVRMTSDDATKDDKPLLENDGGSDKIVPEQEFHYSFSNDVNVTMMFLEDRLNITATCLMGLERRPISLQFTLNIEEFFVQRARMLPLRLRGDQWMRKFEINYTRLSVFFKNKFAIHFLDQMDAVVFERRGLFALPHLVLVKIFKKSDVLTILRMSRTCTYFYNIVRDNRLWKFLLKRDFPNEPAQILAVGPPPLPGMMAPPPTPAAPRSTANTEPSSPPSQDDHDDPLQKLRNEAAPDEPDYYEIYKQKFASKYRRLLRINSFPIRFFPTLRMGRRIPSIPFNFDRF